MDMGVEPYLIRATLMGAIAQRLVRKFDGTCHIRDGLLYLNT